MKIQILIDKRMVQVDEGTSVLNAARKAGIVVPTLCHHEALEPYGACRLCVVEVFQHRKRRVVTSCSLPSESGMEIFTESERVKETRRGVIELLLARCPDVPIIQTMARRMGVEETHLKKKDQKACILCGLCVRFCEEVVGASAIGLSSRGTERGVSTPFGSPSDACIGCGSCTYICPTSCIEMVPDEESSGRRRIRIGNLNLEPCPNQYLCKTCDTERNFLDEAKRAITCFRNDFSKLHNTSNAEEGNGVKNE
jgi:NADH dehydrogenase/NADH:ubiquinone oxidoreductase subunit G